MEKGTGTLNFWNSRRNFGVVNTGKVSVYVKRYQVTEPMSPLELKTGDNVEFDRSIKELHSQGQVFSLVSLCFFR